MSVRGNYDDVNRLCTELSAEREWAFVNVNMRPYYAEGSKTVAFEIAEQLGWELPDRCVVPIASGSLYTKIARGFEEWLELGLIDGQPAGDERRAGDGLLAGGQRLRRGGDFCQPVKPRHDRQVAGHRQPGRRALRARPGRSARGGSIDSVTDDEIRAGIALLAETTGVFTETAGGVTTAVLTKLAERGDIDRHERVVLVITGDGLKTLDAVRGLVHDATRSSPRSSRSRRATPTPRPGSRPDVGHGQDPDPAAGGGRGRQRGRGRAGRPWREVLDAALRALRRAARPDLRRDRALRRFVNVYVGGEDIRFLDGLETPVADGGEVTILPAVAGG